VDEHETLDWRFGLSRRKESTTAYSFSSVVTKALRHCAVGRW